MFTKRLLSGLVLIVAAAFLLYYGGLPLFLASMAVSLIGLFELYRVMKIERDLPGLVGYLAVLAYYGLLWCGRLHLVTFLAIASLMVLMTLYVILFPRYGTEQITVAFFGIFYVGLMFSFLYQVREALPDGRYLVWLIIFSSWGCDTCAYCVGMLLGKHKMAPKLSPKKSVEGAVGGVIGAAVLGFLFGFFFDQRMPDVLHAGAISSAACAIAAVISQIGDLAASAIKRNHGIKDYGDLIPGHGGILDRFDSMIFTAPAIYYAVYFLTLL